MAVTELPQSKELEEKLSLRQRMLRALRVAGTSVKTGRTTSSILGNDGSPQSALGQINRLFQQYAPLAYQLPWEILDYVELLSTYNPDYSQAVENIKMLANSGHVLQVNAGSDLATRKTKEYLEGKARLIQESHGGIDGVIDKLLDQAATFGAIAGEWVLNDELTEVIDFADISPKKIRFFWIEEEQKFAPFQMVKGSQLELAKKRGQEVRASCVRLNEVTFRYYAFDSAPESPYGTPPFLAALANIAIQRDMVHNMAQIIKKIGLLGIIDIEVERLQPLPGETDDQYATRAGNYLAAYVDVAEGMARDGGMVHFDDVKTTTWSIGGNAAGATNLHKANEEMVFSGLKSMPSVQGRSFSTTETYAGVAYEIVLRNVMKYQRAVKRVIESGYWLMASMAGLQPDSISISFNQNRSLNRLQEAQAAKTEVANGFMKWLLGIIDQTMLSHELGYSEPAIPMDAPPAELISIASAHEVEPPDISDFGNQATRRDMMEDEDDRELEED